MNMLKLNLAAVAAVAVLAAAFVFGLLRPGMRELRDCQAQIADKQAKVQDDQQQLGNVGDVYASILHLDEAMHNFRVRLPPERRFGEFLNALSENLERCEISDYIVQPRTPLRVDEKKLPESYKLAVGTTILPVTISFHGSFSQVFKFLSDMDALSRLSHVESIKLVNDEQRPGQVSAEIALHTYQHSDFAKLQQTQ
jgi:Tfp pilus assembly protein PilO